MSLSAWTPTARESRLGSQSGDDVLHGLAVCAGFAGLELGLRLVFGSRYRIVCVVESEAFAAAGLVALMEAGHLDTAPIWDDLTTFNGRRWRGAVDLVSAGFPCQPYSVAGRRRGDEDERALWPHFIRLVREVRPALVFIENVPPFLAWYRPIGDRLSRLGYDYQAGLFRASEVGAPHRRERLFVLAHASYDGRHRNGERHGQVQAPAPHGQNSDRCDATLADASRQGRSEVAAGTPVDEAQDEGRASPIDHQSGSHREALERARDRQRRLATGDWSRRRRATGAPDGALERRDRIRGANVALAPDDIVVDTAGNRWREGRSASTVGDGRTASAIAGVGLGDADGTGFEDRLPGAESGAQPAAWPPSPADAEDWRAVLALRPDLAPAVERDVLRMADRMAARVDRLRGVGNGVVPLVAAYAFCTLAAQAGLDIDRLAR